MGRRDRSFLAASAEASSDSVPAGTVISQDPSAGAKVPVDTKVRIVVSTGPKQVKVPYVVTWSADDAKDELEDAGFAVAITTTPVANSQVGDVITQNPPGGQAPEGSTVTINVGVRQSR